MLTLREATGGRLRALLPVVRHGGWTHVPSNPHTPAVAPVADGPDALARLAEALVNLAGPALRVGPLDAAGGFHDALAAVAAARRRIVRSRTVLRSPYAVMDDGGPLALVSRGLRKEIGRYRRRLEAMGDLRLEIAREPDAGLRALDDLVDIEARGWKGAAGTAISGDDGARRLYRDVTVWAARTGRLRLAVLRLDGRPLAAELDLAEGDALYALKTGFDPEFARLGPGHLLVATLLEELRPEGVRRYEMLGDDDPYKMRWTDTVHDMREVTVFTPSPRGVAALGRARLVPAVHRRAVRLAGAARPGDR